MVLSADSPAGHRWANDREREAASAGGPAFARTKPSLADIARLFGNRSLLLLTLSYGALSYVQYLFFYWIEYYFKTELKLPKSESRQAAFIVTMAMAAGMACGGWLADRLCRAFGQTAGCRIVAFGGMGLCALFSLLGISTSDTNRVVVCFSLSFAALGLCEGIFWTTAPILEKRLGGLACALLNTGGNGVGLLAPVITPILGRYYGWNSAIVVAGIVCAVGGLLWLGIRSTPTASRSP